MTAEIAAMVARLQVDAFDMPVQIRLSLELLRAWLIADHGSTRVGILALGVVGFHMRFPVVASLEQLAADFAVVCSFRECSPLALLLDAVRTRHHGRPLKARPRFFANEIVEVHRVWCRRRLCPLTSVALVQILCWSIDGRDTVGVGRRAETVRGQRPAR